MRKIDLRTIQAYVFVEAEKKFEEKTTVGAKLCIFDLSGNRNVLTQNLSKPLSMPSLPGNKAASLPGISKKIP